MVLHGTVALVTGSGRRLGRAISLALAEQGADLLLHVHTSSGEDIAQEIIALGRHAVVIRADLSYPSEAARLGREALAVAGRVDVLVNNAAVLIPTPLPTLTLDTWQGLLRTNLTAPFILSLSLGRAMQMQGSGKIIQLGDWSGSRPLPGYLPYCVAKGGLQSLTQALAKALAPQVQVNAVAPGPVLPPAHYDSVARHTLERYTPLSRLGKAEDVVRA
ncbi:MAG: SDR family NAD(P)-dependent oxidoreductase, partial [Candidatus Binatia bacterium]